MPSRARTIVEKFDVGTSTPKKISIFLDNYDTTISISLKQCTDLILSYKEARLTALKNINDKPSGTGSEFQKALIALVNRSWALTRATTLNELELEQYSFEYALEAASLDNITCKNDVYRSALARGNDAITDKISEESFSSRSASEDEKVGELGFQETISV